jgi:hypothetical protein
LNRASGRPNRFIENRYTERRRIPAEGISLGALGWFGRLLPRATGALDGLGYRQHQFFFVRAADELNADWQALRGVPEGQGDAGKAGQV